MKTSQIRLFGAEPALLLGPVILLGCMAFVGCSDTHLYLRGGVLDGIPQAGAPQAPSPEKMQKGPNFTKAEEALDVIRIRLMEGIITHDKNAISQLLTPDFQWREDEAPIRETPFEYWDRHKLWGDLQRLAGASVVRQERLVLSPKGADKPDFKGARLAWRQVGGEWRLSYFYAGSAE